MHALIATALLAAAEGDTEQADGGSWLSFAFLPLMLVVFYFLIIRPNSRKRKEAVALQAAIQIGDEVITTAGIIGRITGEDGPTRFWLEIDDDVQVRIGRGFIQGRIAESTDAESDDASSDSSASSSDRD